MATRSAEAEVKVIFSATLKNTLDDGQVATVTIGDTVVSGKLQDGVEANQVSRVWADKSRSIDSGSTEDIDIYDFAGEDIGAGDGCDGLGQAIEMEEIVTFAIKHVSGTGRLELMPTNPANYWACAPALTVANGGALKAGGVFLMHQPSATGFPVTDASSHKIRLGANGGAVVYDIYILGRHDDEASSSSSCSTSSTSSSSTSSSSCSSMSSSSTSSSSTSSTSSSSSCSTTTA